MTHVCVFDLTREEVGMLPLALLDECRDRHSIKLPAPVLAAEGAAAIRAALRAPEVTSAVFVLEAGLPYGPQLRAVRTALRRGMRVWLYWPHEGAVEQLDLHRWRQLALHWALHQGYRRSNRPLGAWRALRGKAGALRARLPIRRRRAPDALPAASAEPERPAVLPAEEHAWIDARLDALLAAARPVPLRLGTPPAAAHVLPGTTVYLRTDFWAKISSGGSYGHTCHVARQLALRSEHLVAFTAHRYPLLDEMGVAQVVLPDPGFGSDEATLIRANELHWHALRTALQALRPTLIYERLVLGNFAGVRLSQELGIPYVVEYNGSEISMRRSFDGRGYELEDLYLKAEQAAFQQASLISVVSDVIKDDLVSRGVSAERVLVNPNGVDIDAYRRPGDAQRRALRRELGWGDEHVVVGFTGTFGGWHGIDVLAAALPWIARRCRAVRFLFIGDGNLKPLLDEAVAANDLGDRVHCSGRVPQQEGARLLGACDVLVSPHNTHMVDSRFFGSPTKIFEYMAMGVGIAATDLEQIGAVLSPAWSPADLDRADGEVRDERALLCKPGSVEEFADAVVALAERPRLREALGRNARAAAERHFTWQRHVDRTLRALEHGVRAGALALPAAGSRAAPAAAREPRSELADPDKREIQDQWDRDPCGSHYARGSAASTLDWYAEVERYRYGQYAPWMREVMEFGEHAGHDVLEIGGGLGTDLAQFAEAGARVTDVDLCGGHLEHARRNFRLRGLRGRFLQSDAESLAFPDASFDLVYSNGVIHHTPNTDRVVSEIFRVLRPGGRLIVMVYALRSLHYWRQIFLELGLKQNQLQSYSMGEILSRNAELSSSGARPLVKVYSRPQLRRLFAGFEQVRIVQRQMLPVERPLSLRWLPTDRAARIMGWNLILKARKPRSVS